MRKKLLSALLCLVLLSSSALALPLQSAAPAGLTLTEGLQRLERFADWDVAEDGTWSVRAYQSAAALNQLGQETPGTGVAYFDLELTGDLNTGVILPMFVIRFVGTRTVNADTVSVAVNGTRYDFRAFSAREPLGDTTCEAVRCPLNEQGLAAMRALSTATLARVRMFGTSSYGFTAERRETYTTTKAQIEGSSLSGVMPMLDELDALGVAKYDLWDLSAARCERLYGFEPDVTSTKLGRTDGTIALSSTFDMLARGDETAGVRQLQELLIRTGFMQGRADGSFGDGTVRAVKAARRYWGLMECGIADQLLIDCLTGKIQRRLGADNTSEAGLSALGSLCAVDLTRSWFARTVTTDKGGERAVENADNVFFVAEGEIENTSPETLAFYRQLTAELTLDGAKYICTILCETDGGARFDAEMLPGARARLIVCAEVPARLSGREGWTLTLKSDGESAEWTR